MKCYANFGKKGICVIDLYVLILAFCLVFTLFVCTNVLIVNDY